MNSTFFQLQMDNKLASNSERFEPLFKKLKTIYEQKALDHKTYKIFEGFINKYIHSAYLGGTPDQAVLHVFDEYIDRLQYLYKNPFSFEPYHKQILAPFNYYKFGMNFVRPLINKNVSQYLGKEHLTEIHKNLKQNHNVILLANHQTEVDPHSIEYLIEKDFPHMAQDMIFVAGDRVLLDQLAIPVSMGRNLLCIYSKKHISNPPSQMEEKRLHNKKTMELMSGLLKEGGKCIYVATSGGRDRPDENGYYPIAPLDPQAIELFYIMAKKSKVTTHFNSLALLTHTILPPPKHVESELGEERSTSYSGIYANFGKEIDMENFSGDFIENKIERRHLRSDYIWNQINHDYQDLIKLQDQYES